MSRHPDPCYCDQACDYEELLERILNMPKTLGHYIVDDKLMQEIKKKVKEYKVAQAEYNDEELDDEDW